MFQIIIKRKRTGFTPYNSRNCTGFTLVEMLVAVSIFVTALSLVVGIFVRTIRMQGAITNLIEVQSNANIIIEQMAREIRSGFNFDAPPIAGSRCGDYYAPTLTFQRVRGMSAVDVSLNWNEAATKKKAERQEGLVNPPVTMNASNVLVDRLCFWLNEETAPDPDSSVRNTPWRVTVFLTIAPTDKRLGDRKFDIQTTVAARIVPSEVR